MRKLAMVLVPLLIIALIIGAVGCSGGSGGETATPTPTPTTNDLTGLVITLERTVCFGACPAYELTVYGNGTVVYEGSEFVRVVGIRTTIISEEKVRLLVSEFDRIDYFALSDSYEDYMVTDLPFAITSITIDERTKTVRHYHGDLSAPEELTELENQIDEIVDSKRWTVRLPEPPLQVHYIDVGQGDSILLDLGEAEVLIDAGDRSPGVVTYLEDYVDGSLEAMIATHPHADHIGGLIAVLDTFEVEGIWLNGDTSTSNTYSDFMDKVNAEGAEVYKARRGQTITVGSLSFDVLHPVEPLVGNTNNNSIVLMLSYGEVDFLFTGDAEQEAEASILVQSVVPVPDIEILKVGHHGSRTSSSQAFLDIIQPEVAIYMAGIGNRYGHPHEETISALQDIGAEICGTDTHGTVVVETDGQDYIVITTSAPVPTATPTATPTSTPIDTPTPTPMPSPIPMGASNVQITYIFYDGAVPYVESDEYVAIKNLGDVPQDLQGWVLKDISEGYPSFTFPHYILQPGATIRVYTNEIHPEWGSFSFGYGKAVWNNTDPDVAALYDSEGHLVSTMSY
ncbi:MAG: lamin tail domain-containing protein [Desulfobacterales bacterium]|nr:lamin tail domain-containing protein [Desulfobacterales bacterium]